MVSDRTANLLTNEEERRAGKLVLESMPVFLFVELTQNCNLSCAMCRSAGKYDRALNMSEQVFEQLTAEVFPYASIIDLRGWGESTVLREFPTRVRKAAESGARLRLVTNGHGMTDSLWELFLSNDDVVVVSVDAATPELAEKLGRGSLERVIRRVRTGVVIRDRLGRGRIHFNTVVSSYNLGELPEIVDLAASLGVTKVVAFPIISRLTTPSHLSHILPEVPSAIERAADRARRSGVLLQFGASLDETLAVDYGLPSRCSHPWTHAYVDYLGRIGFCDHLIARPEFTFGSILDRTFREVWNGDAFQRLRATHLDAGATRRVDSEFWPCNWCYTNRYCDFEDEATEGASERLVNTAGERPLYSIRSDQVARRSFI